MEKFKVITIKDIAIKTGLSISTVSLALNGKGRISDKTRSHIIQQAEKMGYQPNILASTLSMKKGIRIGVICPENDVYFCTVLQGIEACFSEISHYKVELIYFNVRGYEPQEQIDKLRESIEAGVDGILLTPLTTRAILNLVREIVKSGVTIVTYTNDLPSSGRLCFVGQNGKVAGKMAGDLMNRMLAPKSKILLFQNDSPLIITQQRMTAFIDCMQKSEKQFVLKEPCKFPNDLDTASCLMEELIVEEIPDAIYTNNMLGTLAIGKALQKLNLKEKITVFGYDANDEIDKMLKEGYIDLTLYQDPFYQGYYALLLLFRNLFYKQKSKVSSYYIRTLVLTKMNVGERELLNKQLYL